jgi:ketosteroid isomerase-like protein
MPKHTTPAALAIAAAVASGACAGAPTTPSVEPISKAFIAGDGDAFASHYTTPSAIVLGDATVWRAHELSERARAAGPAVRTWDLSSPVTHAVENGSYMLGSSLTVIEPPNVAPIRIQATRLIGWSGFGADARVRADVSIPDRPTALPDPIRARYDSLNASWSRGDAPAARTHYTPDALFVLSDGSAHADSGLDAFFAKVPQMGVTDQRDTPERAWSGGDDGVFVAGTFSFTIPGDAGPVTVSGCNLDVWKREGAVWRIAVRVAQPAGAPTCPIPS